MTTRGGRPPIGPEKKVRMTVVEWDRIESIARLNGRTTGAQIREMLRLLLSLDATKPSGVEQR